MLLRKINDFIYECDFNYDHFNITEKYYECTNRSYHYHIFIKQ